MNWGHKIFIVIILFISAMISMVYIAFQQTNEMIEKNYYDKEVKFQTKIDAANNLSVLNQGSLLKQDEEHIEVIIPTSLASQFNNGKIEFIRNDDESKDRKIDIVLDENELFLIDKSLFFKGQYTVKISWKNSTIEYYKEQVINII